MSSVRDILILAKSIKKGRYCLAGIDVATGEWIRPVSSERGDGIAMSGAVANRNGKMAAIYPLDVVRFFLKKPVPLESQPENWLISDGPYRYVGKVARKELTKITDNPAHLWMHGRWSHKLAYDALRFRSVDSASLYIVRVSKIVLRVTTNFCGSKRTTALFRYKNGYYALNVTDPRYGIHQSKKIGEEVNLYDRFLCVSRTDEFYGYCYKVVAAIL